MAGRLPGCLRPAAEQIKAGVGMKLPLALLLPLAIAACGSQPSPGAARPPLAGAAIGGPFALVDGNGRPTTERRFAGRYRIVYFGYTFCPDVCPTDVQVIGAALREVERSDPAKGAKVVPIFITVDPERDTPAVVRQFVAAFHPRMVGLTGTPDQIARVAREYAVYSAKGATQPGGGYLMNHSRQAYLMDPDGKPMALLPTEEGADAVAAEIRRWVS